MLSVFVITAFFPALTVFLLWRLGFSTSIYLRTQKERIVPYISSIIYFFWAFYVSKNLPGSPPVMTFFFLGIFLTMSLAVMANNYFKISMHAMAVGGAATNTAMAMATLFVSPFTKPNSTINVAAPPTAMACILILK